MFCDLLCWARAALSGVSVVGCQTIGHSRPHRLGALLTLSYTGTHTYCMVNSVDAATNDSFGLAHQPATRRLPVKHHIPLIHHVAQINILKVEQAAIH